MRVLKESPRECRTLIHTLCTIFYLIHNRNFSLVLNIRRTKHVQSHQANKQSIDRSNIWQCFSYLCICNVVKYLAKFNWKRTNQFEVLKKSYIHCVKYSRNHVIFFHCTIVQLKDEYFSCNFFFLILAI